MQELILNRGIPASGKSTYAAAWLLAGENRVRVSRDDIRFAMFGRYTDVDEGVVTRVEDAMIDEALVAGKSVIVDDCNIDQKYITRLAEIGFRHGVKVSVNQFDISLATALARNANRERKVPNAVINSMYSRLQNLPEASLEVPIVEQYVPNYNLPRAIIVDIDGTIAERQPVNGRLRSPYDWKRVGEDTTIEEVLVTVSMYYHFGYRVILMSGRDGICRPETEKWLADNNIEYHELFMRGVGDSRKDSIVKQELFDNCVRNHYNVEVVFDDRQQVVNMWRSLGLRVYQVAPGNF